MRSCVILLTAPIIVPLVQATDIMARPGIKLKRLYVLELASCGRAVDDDDDDYYDGDDNDDVAVEEGFCFRI